MPRPKGHEKSGGRVKGTLTQKRKELYEIADEMGVDPFEVLLQFAKGDWQGLGYQSETYLIPSQSGAIEKRIIEPELRFAAAKELAKYLRPQLKAIEHSVDSENPLEPKVELTEEFIKSLIKQARD